MKEYMHNSEKDPQCRCEIQNIRVHIVINFGYPLSNGPIQQSTVLAAPNYIARWNDTLRQYHGCSKEKYETYNSWANTGACA